MQTYKIYSNVRITGSADIEDYVVIGRLPGSNKVLKTIIGKNSIIRSHTVIYAGNEIGDNFQTGHHVLIRENNQIGDDVSIGSSSVVEHHVKIGSGVRIHSQVFIPEYSVLEDGCWIGPNVVLTNAKYPRSSQVKENLVGPTIKEGAKIGANATILSGVIVGNGALVGAGSVVTEDVPSNVVVVGSPAKIINELSNLPYE